MPQLLRVAHTRKTLFLGLIVIVLLIMVVGVFGVQRHFLPKDTRMTVSVTPDIAGPRLDAAFISAKEADRISPRDPEAEQLYQHARRLREPIHVYANRMPFSDKFWAVDAKGSRPTGIRGFFTALPIDWTKGENNHPDMNKLLLTQVVEPDGRQTVALSDVVQQNGAQS